MPNHVHQDDFYLLLVSLLLSSDKTHTDILKFCESEPLLPHDVIICIQPWPRIRCEEE